MQLVIVSQIRMIALVRLLRIKTLSYPSFFHFKTNLFNKKKKKRKETSINKCSEFLVVHSSNEQQNEF